MFSKLLFSKSGSTKLPFRFIAPLLAASAATLAYQRPSQALSFNFNFAEGTSDEVINGVQQAGSLWSSVLLDDVTVNIDVEFSTLPEGYLGGARPDMVRVNYSDAVNQFDLDQTSADDQSAFANLPTYEREDGDLRISRRINKTNQWFGTWLTDNSTDNLWLTRANAKSLGIVAGSNTAVDAAIRLSDQINWDFDGSDGTSGDQYDFVSTVLHELGHSLGFLSGVDVLDANYEQRIFLSASDYDYVTSLDLFRKSDSTAGKARIDWTVDSYTEYFSVDGGQAQIAEFANGSTATGDDDKFQISHFKAGTNSVMSPTLQLGTQSSITDIDLRMMDVIGWDLAAGSQVDSQNSIAYTQDGQGFDGALRTGSWSSTSFRYTFWQEDSFLASQVSDQPSHQDVPEPSSLLGLSAIAFWGIKRHRSTRS